MKMLGAIIFICAALLETTSTQADFDSQVGVVDANKNGQLCLIIANPSLRESESVNLVVLSNRQRVAKARVKQKLDRSCASTDTADESFYSIELEKKSDIQISDDVPLIAVISTKPLIISRGRATGDVDKDGKPEFFRRCATSEGLHFTVWTGQPLTGKRRWHFYYYLGYDVEPSCVRRDYI